MKQGEKENNANKVFPQNESGIHEEEGESANEINASDFEKPQDETKMQKSNIDVMNEQQGVEANEDSEWKDIRVDIDKTINKGNMGDFIQKFIGTISVLSSVAFIVMTHFDWSMDDPCCMQSQDTIVEVHGLLQMNKVYICPQ